MRKVIAWAWLLISCAHVAPHQCRRHLVHTFVSAQSNARATVEICDGWSAEQSYPLRLHPDQYLEMDRACEEMLDKAQVRDVTIMIRVSRGTRTASWWIRGDLYVWDSEMRGHIMHTFSAPAEGHLSGYEAILYALRTWRPAIKPEEIPEPLLN